MSTSTTAPVSEAQGQAQATISPFGRVVGTFFSPKATFEDIVRRPSWVLPVVLLTVFSIAATVVFNQRVNWREFMSQQIEKSPQAANLSAEQKQQRIEGGAKITPIIVYITGVCAPIVFTLLLALIMWGAYNLLAGANTNFATSFAIMAHAGLPNLVSSVLLILILFLKDYGTVNVDNPIAANLAAVLPDEAAKWLVAIGKNVDLFVFWTLILLAIGFAAANPKKLRGGKSFTIAFSMWLVWVVVRAGGAFISS